MSKKNSKTVIEQHLREALADTFTLYLKTHSFHWNVEGPLFDSLHKMFEAQYTELWEASDTLAERLRAIGVYAPRNVTEMNEATILKAPGNKIPDGVEMCRLLAADHQAVSDRLKKAIPLVQDAGDELTADMFIERGQIHEKAAWMLTAITK